MVKLRAESPEDVTAMSAYLQDATVCVGDIAWLPKQRRFALVCNRFMWEADGQNPQRIRVGLHFENVLSSHSRNIPARPKDHVLELLTVHATQQDDRATIRLIFAGDADVHLEAEIIEAEMEDIGDPWETPNTPSHAVE